MTSNLVCKNCSKVYLRESAFQKHKLVCIKSAVDIDNLNLKDLVLELVKKNQKLENDILELQRWVNTKKKKIVIVDWLNENIKPNFIFSEFIQNIKIDQYELDIIFENNIIDGIVEIINNYLQRCEVYPIKAFEQKDNTLYVYTQTGWKLLTNDDYVTIISNIYKKIMTAFKCWQDKNESRLYTSEFSEKYVKYVKKIMGGDIPIERQRAKIHRNIYKSIKLDLNNTIEYEFT